MRQDRTLRHAAVLAFVLAVVVTILPVPYVALVPGPVTDTLGKRRDGVPIITVKGHKTYPTDGNLYLTTVGVRGGPPSPLSLGLALRWWFDRHKAVLPQMVLYPPGQTAKQVEQQNTQEMQDSQQQAISAALRALGFPVTVQVTVAGVVKGKPADGKLKPGDVIARVDGLSATSRARLQALLARRAVGAPVTLDVVRGGKAQRVTLETVAAPGSPGRPIVGIDVGERHKYPFEVSINLKQVGGPSAGLMFSLGIIDRLTPGFLNGGKNVAGTGTIDDEGTVGAIGGIQQKLVAARAAGAVVFLTPAGNCAAAVKVRPKGLTLVKVATLRQALDRLAAIRAGGAVATC